MARKVRMKHICYLVFKIYILLALKEVWTPKCKIDSLIVMGRTIRSSMFNRSKQKKGRLSSITNS